MTLELVNPYADFYNDFKDLLYTQPIITPREYGMRYRKRNKPFKRK
jgi:hypothetical protein